MIKRIAIVTLVVVGSAAIAISAIFAMTFTGRKPISDGAEIGGIAIVQDGVVAVGVVPLGEGHVALIDAGNDPAGHPILEELARRGLGAEAVTMVLVTHGHPDHVASLGAFPRARVAALAAEVPLLEGRVGHGGPLGWMTRANPVRVDRVLADGEQIHLGDLADTVVRVFAVPGHTRGSAAYLVNGVLFIGDAADVTVDGELRGAPWIFSEDTGGNRVSLTRLLDRLRGETVTAIVPSHSGDTDGLDALTTFVNRSQTR